MSDILEQLSELRMQRGISIRSLAEKTGYNISNLSLIEQGKRQPQLDTLIKILDALDAELVIRKRDGE